MLKVLFISILTSLIFTGCTATEVELDPVRKMKLTYKNEYAYTITISDMDLVKGQFKHKYKIFKLSKDQAILIDSTDWENVSDDFFNYHKNDLGMEVTSKLMDGHINDLPTPPGYTNFIGNEDFGRWETDSVPVYWQFEPRYENLIVELNLQNITILKSEYDVFNSDYQFNRPYYGSNISKDSTRYGTNSASMRHSHPSFYIRRSSHGNFIKPRSTSRSGGIRGGGGYGK